MEFFQWTSTYSNVLSNVYGEDREEAIRVMDNDAQFDRWLTKYSNKHSGKKQKAGNTMDKEAYLASRTYGGE